jgi:hypothetical protein
MSCASFSIVLHALVPWATQVQNRAAISANATQHELVQAAAERQRAEDKAAKQLERVQQQMAEFVYPVQQLSLSFSRAFERALVEGGCEGHMTMYAYEWVSPPTQPNATVYNAGNPETYKRIATNPFMYTLPPEDLGRLAADPMRRARWEELVVHTVLPSLRELMPVLQSKVRRWCIFVQNFCFTC